MASKIKKQEANTTCFFMVLMIGLERFACEFFPHLYSSCWLKNLKRNTNEYLLYLQPALSSLSKKSKQICCHISRMNVADILLFHLA